MSLLLIACVLQGVLDEVLLSLIQAGRECDLELDEQVPITTRLLGKGHPSTRDTVDIMRINHTILRGMRSRGEAVTNERWDLDQDLT